MTPTPEVQERLRRYVLGQLAEDAREEIEKGLLANDELFEELLTIEDEIIDDYLGERLNASDRAAFENHFLATPERHEQLKFGRAFRRYQSSKTAIPPAVQASPVSRPLTWINQLTSSPLRIAAFAIVVIGIAFGVWQIAFRQSEVAKGLLALNAAYREQRPLESRISNLNYAPYVVIRGPGEERTNQDELRRAELTLLNAQNKNPNAAARHALGKVYLAKKDFDKAIEQFNEALKSDPNNAQIYSDLGAAWLERGRSLRDREKANRSGGNPAAVMEAFLHSIDDFNKALELSPNSLEALFNRALAREELVLPQAEDDWKAYLEKDGNSQWSVEARRHLNELQQKRSLRSQPRAELLPTFLEAVRARNDQKVYELINGNAEAIGGNLLWWQLADAYLQAATRGSENEARSYLQALQYGGIVQQKHSGDPFVNELAAFYASCTSAQIALVAEAHATLEQGHNRMRTSAASEAVPLYEKAKAQFDAAHDEWESLFARYWIGYAKYRESRYEEAIDGLTQLADASTRREYLWLLEKATVAIGSITVDRGQLTDGIKYQKRSLEIARKMNNAYETQKVLAVLAYTYRQLANREQSLAYLQSCLESARTQSTGPRQMYRNYFASADILHSFGHYDAAAEFDEASLEIAFEQKDPILENQSYVSLAAIKRETGNYGEALRYAGLAKEAAQKVDEKTQLKPLADALLQLAHVSRQSESYETAMVYYDQAIALYSSKKLFPYVYESHKGKLLNCIKQGSDSQAEAQMALVVDLFEQHRSQIREEQNRNGFFDFEADVYDIAIDFQYARLHNKEKAFDYAEASRARSLLDLMSADARQTTFDNSDLAISPAAKSFTLDEIRARMPKEIQIVQYAVLPDRVITWVVSRDTSISAENSVSEEALNAMVLNYSKLLATPSQRVEETHGLATELYSILIKPVETLLDRQKQICIVSDKILNRLPFAALISPDTGDYFIKTYVVSFAPSSSVLVSASESAQRRSGGKAERLLSVGDPHFDVDEFPNLSYLPSSGSEARRIAEYYRDAHPLVGEQATKRNVERELERADVIQVASHYVVDEQNPMFSKLLLTRTTRSGTGNERSDGFLEAHEIYTRRLPKTRLVVLSACSTAIERIYKGEGMIGMSRPFLAAGVPLVAASLWQVDSKATAELMKDLHRYRKSGLSSAASLRQAQIDMLKTPGEEFTQPYYWAAFVMIGGYATF